MKKIFKKLIQYLLACYFVLTLFQNILLPENLAYYVACMFIFAIAIFFASLILGFLTIRENFLTSFLMSTIVCIGVFFLLKAFMPGFFIEEFTFNGLDTGSLVVNPFEVTTVYTIVVASASYSFLTTVLNLLEKSS